LLVRIEFIWLYAISCSSERVSFMMREIVCIRNVDCAVVSDVGLDVRGVRVSMRVDSRWLVIVSVTVASAAGMVANILSVISSIRSFLCASVNDIVTCFIQTRISLEIRLVAFIVRGIEMTTRT
jgi:hypothetical protein